MSSSITIHTRQDKDYYFFRPRITSYIKQGDYGFIALLPVKRAVRYFRQQLIDVSAGQILADPGVFSFDELLSRIYSSLPGARRILNNDHLLLLLRALLKDHGERFPYLLKNASLTLGLVKKIADLLSELRRFGYNRKSFADIDLEEREKNPLKFADIENLLLLLEKHLGKNLIDEPYARHEAARNLTEARFRELFPRVRHLYISGYGLFTPAMFLFIEKAKTFLDVHIKLDYNKENPDLFRHVQPAVKRFRKMGARFEEQKEGAGLGASLFNRDKQAREKIDFSRRVTIQPLMERKEEAAFIAAEIRRLHQQQAVPLHRMAVTFPDLERYVPVLRRVFSDYQIPYNLSTGFNLKQSPLIRLFLRTLQLIRSRFDYLQTPAFFQSAFIPKDFAFERNLLHNIFVEQRCKNLTPGWMEKVKSRLDDSQKGDASLNRQLDWLQDRLQLFENIPSRAPVSVFRRRYLELLKNLGLLHWFKNENPHLSERQREKEFRAYNRFMKLFEKVIWILDHLYAEKEISLNSFSEFLETAVSRAVYNVTEWPEYGVQIMPRLEVLAMNPQVLFLGGLTDGEFPRAGAKDVFFNDTLRDKLGLTAAEELLDQDRYVFYLLMASSAERVVLTYPRYEEERALVPSTFLSDLSDVAGPVWREQAPDEDYFLNPQVLWLKLGRYVQLRKFDQAAELSALLQGTHETAADSLQKLWKRIELAATRRSGSSFSQYEANLSGLEAVSSDLQERFKNRVWSVSRLEKYAFCPLRFFLENILEIEDLPEIEEEISPLERGLLVHKILDRFYKTLLELKETARPLKHRQLLLQIAEQAFAKLPYRGLLWELERSVFYGTQERPGLLDVFLKYDQRQIDESGFVPTFFEKAFGAQEPLYLEQGSEALGLMGRIDRVDMNEKGQAMIFDYKTGLAASKTRPGELMQGLHFQLPLYSLALEKSEPQSEAVYAAFYIVKDAENCKRKELLADAQKLNLKPENKKAWIPNKEFVDETGEQLSFQQVRLRSLALALNKTAEIRQGVFRHTRFPDAPSCRQYCPFRRICQKNTAKILRAEKAN